MINQAYKHSSVFLIGDSDRAQEYIEDIFSKENEGVVSYVKHSYDLFGIDDAHDMRAADTERSGSIEEVHILYIKGISHDAVDALLKTLEEPRSHTHYYFVLEEMGALPKTLLSRVECVRLEESVDTKPGETFIKMSIAEREEYIKNKMYKNSESNSENIVITKKLLRSLFAYIKKTDPNNIERIRIIFEADRSLSQDVALPKPVIQHVAIQL